MTKPSDFSPAEAIEVKSSDDAVQSRRVRWALRILGIVFLAGGWVAVALSDWGSAMFVVDTVVFVAMAAYAFVAAALSRMNAVSRERKLRLRLLVHNMELENMSMRDDLTQLFNRRYLFERLERELHTAKGFQRPLAYIAIAVKPLRHINHTYGYATGDEALAAFGRFLMDRTRATDIPARVGGGKFGIILPDTSKRGAYTMVDRLNSALAAAHLMEEAGFDVPLAVSFGVSGYPWGSDTVDGIVREAEAEMATGSSAADVPMTLAEPDDESDGGIDDGEIPTIFKKSGEAASGV